MKRFVIFNLMLLILAVAVMAQQPKEVSICDIQQYNGVQEGDLVRVTGVVVAPTGRYGSRLTIIAEEGGGPWCFIAVYDAGLAEDCGNTPPSERLSRFEAVTGQCLTVEGIVQEYYDATEIKIECADPNDDPYYYEVSDSCFPIPEPILLPTGEVMQEQYEWCLIQVVCSVVSEAPDQYGVFMVDDGSGPCYSVGSYKWEDFNPQLGDEFCSIIGVLDYKYETFRLRPRVREEYDQTPFSECSYCTPPEIEDFVLTLNISKQTPDCFYPGDTFSLSTSIQNPNSSEQSGDFYLVLDVYGSYFFYPTWTSDLQNEFITVPANDTLNKDILTFTWPSGAGSASDIYFHSIVTKPGTFDVFSNYEFVSFCFME